MSIELHTGEHLGLKCAWLTNGHIRLAVTTERGPRAIFLGWAQGTNLMAELPGISIPSQNGPYDLLGGHRLWHAPEWSTRTYWPETQTLSAEAVPGGIKVCVPADGGQIAKELTFVMDAAQPRVTVTHVLRNAGLWPIELAPWAITQCRLGGIVMLPQPGQATDPEGLLPSQRYSFWPYTQLNDGRIALGERMTLIHTRAAPPTKLGYFNTDGWIAYWIEGTLFTKRFTPVLEAAHPDYGCNVECYQNEAFVELETLGPLTPLKPGASVTHVEVWEMQANAARP